MDKKILEAKNKNLEEVIYCLHKKIDKQNKKIDEIKSEKEDIIREYEEKIAMLREAF